MTTPLAYSPSVSTTLNRDAVSPSIRQQTLYTPYAYNSPYRTTRYLQRLMQLLRNDRRMSYILRRPRLHSQLAKHLVYVRQEYPVVWPAFEPYFRYYFVERGDDYLDPDVLYTVFGGSRSSVTVGVVVTAVLLVLIVLAVVAYLKRDDLRALLPK